MNAGRDVERLVANWLAEEAAVPVPDRVIDAIGRTVDRTPQRRFVAVRRNDMNLTMARLAGLAAAIVLAIGVIAWLGRGTPPVGVTVTPIPTSGGPSPTPSAKPMATGILALSGSGPFDPGTYLVSDPLVLDITLRLSTEGWVLWNPTIHPHLLALYKGSPDPPGLGLVIVQTNYVYADPCSPLDGPLDPPVGPTVDDFVTALTAQPQTTSTAVTDVTISGFAGKHVEIDFTSEGNCTRISRWESEGGTREAMEGEHDELWILDIDGERWIIDLFSFTTTDDAVLAEARRIVEGLVIEP